MPGYSVTSPPPSREPWLGRLLTRLWLGFRQILEGLLVFLEIIGLRAPRPDVPHDRQLARFRLHHAAFRRLLEANDSFLRSVADLEGHIANEDDCGSSQIHEASLRVLADVNQMIKSLNEIADGRHAALWPRYDAISADLMAVFEIRSGDADQALALDLSAVDCRDVERVGAKMANLGELRNRLGLPAPDGFVLTADAYRRFALQNHVEERSGEGAGSRSEPDTAEDRSERVAERLGTGQVPCEIRREILAAYNRLAARNGVPVQVAVRSSALGEDEQLSFAGQYKTVLNVGREGLVDAWREVAASLHSRGVERYRALQGLSASPSAMPVGFVTMVSAIAGGTVFSRDPAGPEHGQVVVEATPGLGVRVADGSTIPQSIEVILGKSGHSVHRRGQEPQPPSGPGYPDELAEELEYARASACLLSDSEAVQLAQWARVLEDHFGGPQDIEWAMGPDRQLFLLQSRPLELAQSTVAKSLPVPGAAILLSGGETACPGVGIGVAVRVDEDADFDTFPKGAVLVTRRPSAKFVSLMGRAAAIVADSGSTTGHMASLAREFRVPALLGTREATRRVPVGEAITVDASGGFIYRGTVDVQRAADGPKESRARGGRSAKTRRLLRQAGAHIVPLRLTDPRAPEFCAENCRSLHDITRYVHERSYEEMFRIGESLGDFRSAAYYLDVFLPVDLYIIDLGGGVLKPKHSRRLKRNDIDSVPLRALLEGMLHPGIPRWGARPLDLGGFASVVIQHALTSPEEERSFRDPSYALVSDKYLNYTARVGYHFSVVDAYCSATANKNYVQLLFRGGAADTVRRSRRAQAIAGILKEWGFSVEVTGDSTHGRIHKMPRDETTRLIEHVGRLLQFMRQMDVAMTHDGAVEQVKSAFLRGDYSLQEPRNEARGETSPKPEQ